jgi:hypothetical protein
VRRGDQVDTTPLSRWAWIAATLVVVLAGAIALIALLQTPPLVDAARIDRFAYGPQGGNIREFPVFGRDKDGARLDQILAEVNSAPVVEPPVVGGVTREKGRVMLVLYRDDGLMYFVYPGGERTVGISEADEQYLGTLESPQLAALLDEFARAAGARSSAATAPAGGSSGGS